MKTLKIHNSAVLLRDSECNLDCDILLDNLRIRDINSDIAKTIIMPKVYGSFTIKYCNLNENHNLMPDYIGRNLNITEDYVPFDKLPKKLLSIQLTRVKNFIDLKDVECESINLLHCDKFSSKSFNNKSTKLFMYFNRSTHLNLKTLDLSETGFEDIALSNIDFETLKVPNSLAKIYIYENNDLKNLDLSNCKNINSISLNEVYVHNLNYGIKKINKLSLVKIKNKIDLSNSFDEIESLNIDDSILSLYGVDDVKFITYNEHTPWLDDIHLKDTKIIHHINYRNSKLYDHEKYYENFKQYLNINDVSILIFDHDMWPDENIRTNVKYTKKFNI